MSLLSPKKILKALIENQGYELQLNKIAKRQYDGPNIAFVHIAKCGGSSIDFALLSAIASKKQPRIDRDMTIASSVASYNKPIETLDDKVAFSEQHLANLSQILKYYLSKEWSLVSGHVSVTESILNAYLNQYSFITVLRDPAERLVSNYIFNKLTNKLDIMPPNSLNTDNLIQEADEILNSRRGWQMANTISAYLSGYYSNCKNSAKEQQKVVLNNLSKFSVVGFLDNLPRFEQNCSTLTGRRISIGKRNVTAKLDSENQQMVKDTLKEYFSEAKNKALLAKLCEFETNTYMKARELFE